MAQTEAEKMVLNDELLGSISFEERIIGRNLNGTLKTVPAAGTSWFLRDSKTPGFSVRVTAKASPHNKDEHKRGLQFYAERKLGGRPCRFPCGDWPAVSISKARKDAEWAISKMKLGEDPNQVRKNAVKGVVADRERAKLTFGFALERDTENRKEADADKTRADRLDVKKWIERMKIWRTPLHEVGADDLQVMMEAVKTERGGTSAVKVWRYTRAAWNRLPSADTPPLDPFAEWLKSHQLPVVKKRQTTIATDEKQGKAWLKAVVSRRLVEGSRAFAHRVIADNILLCLCWGSRRSEISALTVDDVDFEREFVVFRDTKSGRDHFFPLTPGCAEILRQRIADNNLPRGRDVRKAARGEPHYIPKWIFPSQKRGVHLVEQAGVLDIGKKKSGLKIAMHDLRRGFAGEISADVLVDDKGKTTGNFGLVKVAMNHADIQNDVTQGYIMLKPRLKMLRPLYLAHERRVFEAAGLEALLPPEKNKGDIDEMIAALMAKATDDPAAMKKIMAALKMA